MPTNFVLPLIRPPNFSQPSPLDHNNNQLNAAGLTLPSIADATEKRLITEVYEFAKSIAELQLTESELALYSALVLLQPGKFDAPASPLVQPTPGQPTTLEGKTS